MLKSLPDVFSSQFDFGTADSIELHPQRRTDPAARRGLDLLLAQDTKHASKMPAESREYPTLRCLFYYLRLDTQFRPIPLNQLKTGKNQGLASSLRYVMIGKRFPSTL
jgi:hypothetical protein